MQTAPPPSLNLSPRWTPSWLRPLPPPSAQQRRGRQRQERWGEGGGICLFNCFFHFSLRSWRSYPTAESWKRGATASLPVQECVNMAGRADVWECVRGETQGHRCWVSLTKKERYQSLRVNIIPEQHFITVNQENKPHVSDPALHCFTQTKQLLWLYLIHKCFYSCIYWVSGQENLIEGIKLPFLTLNTT